jgi:hypothetical protein
MALAQAAKRSSDPDADGKAPFGHRNHFARIAGHPVFLIRSTQDCHARLILSSGLGACNWVTLYSPYVWSASAHRAEALEDVPRPLYAKAVEVFCTKGPRCMSPAFAFAESPLGSVPPWSPAPTP